MMIINHERTMSLSIFFALFAMLVVAYPGHTLIGSLVTCKFSAGSPPCLPQPSELSEWGGESLRESLSDSISPLTLLVLRLMSRNTRSSIKIKKDRATNAVHSHVNTTHDVEE